MKEDDIIQNKYNKIASEMIRGLVILNENAL
jgi:hypothetical protein